MANSGMKLTKRPAHTPAQQFESLQRKVATGLKAILNDDAARRAAVVSDWHHRPEFETKVTVKEGRIEGLFFISNADDAAGPGVTVADLWKWHNLGTEAHIIEAVNASVLSFIAESGERVFTRRVHHPGTQGHHDDEKISHQTDQSLGPKIDQIVKKALKATSEE